VRVDVTRMEVVTSAPQVSNHYGPHWVVEARLVDDADAELAVLVYEFEESFPVDQLVPAIVQQARRWSEPARVLPEAARVDVVETTTIVEVA